MGEQCTWKAIAVMNIPLQLQGVFKGLAYLIDSLPTFQNTGKTDAILTDAMGTGKSTEKAMHIMTHTSMWVPHQKYILYVSYVLCVCT